MSLQARNYLRQFGIQPALDVSGIDPVSEYNIRSVEDLDELRAAAIQEAEQLGAPGRLHAAWTAALARGLDTALPSFREASGAIPKTMGQLAAEVADAKNLNAQWIDKQICDPALMDVELYGVPITDLPREQVLADLSARLADSQQGPERDVLSNLLASYESAPTLGYTSISYELPEQFLQHEVNSSSGFADSQDAFGVLRHPSLSDQGLEALQIRPSVFGDPALSGVVNYAGGGGEYSAADDIYYQAAIQQEIAADSWHQGDSVNVEAIER